MPSSNALAVDHRARWLKLATTTKISNNNTASVGCSGWGCARDRRTGGLVGIFFPKIPTPASLNDVMFDHFRRVVLSDLLTVEGI
jgi:hypothetical protein